jgi:hypothetical protein
VELSLLHGLRNLLISCVQELAAGPHQLLLLRSAVAAAIFTAAAAPLEAAQAAVHVLVALRKGRPVQVEAGRGRADFLGPAKKYIT